MVKIRIQYLNKTDMQKVVKTLEKDFDIVSLTEESKSKNPKYENSKYKLAYCEVKNKGCDY